MRWLLDTNVLVDAFAGRRDAVKALTTARSTPVDWVGFSAITRLEILGFAGLTPGDEQGLRQLLSEFHEVQVTPDVVDEAIRIRQATRIKIPDVLIAATALQYQAALVTRNTADFKHISGLVVVDSASF